MTAIKAVVKNGHITVAAPTDWPDGCEVLIEPVAARAGEGMREEDWPTTPDGVAALLRRWDQHEPLVMTPEEEAAWEETRRLEKEKDKAAFAEDGDRLRGQWE